MFSTINRRFFNRKLVSQTVSDTRHHPSIPHLRVENPRLSHHRRDGFSFRRRFIRTISAKTKKRVYICPNSVPESERYGWDTGEIRTSVSRVVNGGGFLSFYPRVYFSRLPLSNRVRTNFCARQRRVRIAAQINGVPRERLYPRRTFEKLRSFPSAEPGPRPLQNRPLPLPPQSG